MSAAARVVEPDEQDMRRGSDVGEADELDIGSQIRAGRVYAWTWGQCENRTRQTRHAMRNPANQQVGKAFGDSAAQGVRP